MKNAEAKKSPYSIRQQYWTRRLLAAIDGARMRAAEKKLKRKYKGREWPDAAEPQQMARHIRQVRRREDFK